ncbi:MerR family transcriptional regulator [Kribbella speibonae]|uniref:MerR family transcriptional regulator n=1 Tax=Kribbella speibonae TaxID=1572660 RepID=A0A4R0IWK4_9ACTN|nr:MerR family transcriptional regulator [Kribbella speibonae]TCC33165.1 MerR family transcriptional regulator [Kribbella speibonae]
MLTISQLATHAGVTVRAVRHYHKIGLLPEPGRDHSGYRAYDAGAVVRLIQIHTLAGAGVPLARVQELLDAAPEEFSDGVEKIDKDLRAEIRRLQDTRKRLARLAAGEHLALPASVVDYLDRLRELGMDERYIVLERDAWIMIAAQVPHLVDDVIVQKHQALEHPDTVKLYRLVNETLDAAADDPRIVEMVDLIESMMIAAVQAGAAGSYGLDDDLVRLMDTAMLEAAPEAQRIITLLEQRGWKGWTRIERIPADRL